ncbi:hypothetical protein GWO43_23750 [candidate division KSB1 bacterium]|nr:hypothetical protein [candidate division KSB1 bacterium]NIR73285.1 hypothetical protein [candidate division KSB1 bacterium]NIS26991.1 hypothetical protein [candidate division KSB1 bacterium]NIT73831.1 hypothetical protein [candidate division KSB1 bacterium]NIU27736.1 hypothetical protein [candidate division KSB1 bacterium]
MADPKHVSLVYSEYSREVARELAETFSGQPFNIQFFPDANAMSQNRLKLEDVDKPEACKALVKEHLRRFAKESIPPTLTFVDTTGGKVPMSIGAFQAAEEIGVSSIYVVGKENGFIKDPGKREHGYPVFISDHTDSL